MESNPTGSGDSAQAREALAAIESDRSRVGGRMMAETWWTAPAQGFCTALLVAAPAAGFHRAWLLFTTSALLFLCVEWFFRKRSGLAVSRPAGARGLGILIVLAVVIVCSLGGSVALAIVGLSGWSIAVAALAGVVTTLGVIAYDRTYAAEVRRAR